METERVENERNITAVDLFAGCGGMSLGFEKAGVNVVAAYDNWDAAIDVGTSDVFPDHAPALCRIAPLLAILPNGLPS